MRGFFCIILAIGYTCGGPLNQRQGPPTVSIQNGTIVGSAASGVDSFLGIPFAQPPTGSLRLKSPQPVASTLGTFQATTSPAPCSQVITASDGSSEVLGSEDCLTLNVYRSSSTLASSKLPVLVYIYGGGFTSGSNLLAPGSFFASYSANLGYPYIWVAMNYRLGGFGFLAGKELSEEGNTNLGLKDQRLALQWVQENIAAFGGDPDKVTLWGHSAGSISVMDHTIINNGDNTYNGKPLFRGAMMNSGTIVPALPADSSRAQAVFDNIAQTLECPSDAPKLDCLRSASYDSFFGATTSAIGNLKYGVLDFPYVPRPDTQSDFFASSPDDAIAAGNYARVSVITGDVEDEGTLFCIPAKIQTSDALVDALTEHWAGATRDDVASLVATYPDDPSFGSPFRTGSANNVYPEYKRLSAIYGDSLFTLLRRKYLSVVAGTVDAYSYIGTYNYGTANVGTAHGSDLTEALLPMITVPRDSVDTYYTSFVNFADPNQIQSVYPTWTKYTPTSPQLLNYSANAVEFIADDFRQEQYQAIVAMLDKLRM